MGEADKSYSISATVTAATTASQWSTSTYPPTTDIPPQILECIGAINVRWALAEFVLSGMHNQMLGLDRKEGRVYRQEPRLKDVTETITKIGQMRSLNFPFESWKAFTGQLTECDRIRNLYDHGVWFNHETDGLCIQDTRGEWPKGDPRHPLPKKVAPGHIPVTLEKVQDDLRSVTSALQNLRMYSFVLERALP